VPDKDSYSRPEAPVPDKDSYSRPEATRAGQGPVPRAPSHKTPYQCPEPQETRPEPQDPAQKE
jgi:hypothetical protein